MKHLFLAAALAATAVASAQSYVRVRESPVRSYQYGRYGWHDNNCQPQIIYLGDPYWRPAPRQSNVPFAYGSFFYGQSWSDWQRSQNRDQSRSRWRR